MPIQMLLAILHKIFTNKYVWIAFLLLFLVGVGFFLGRMPSSRSVISLSGGLLSYAPADKLFTTHMQIPLIKVKTSRLTGFYDVLDLKYDRRGYLSGYCLRRYEVGIGYDDVKDLITDTSIRDEICARDWNGLYLMSGRESTRIPEPVILSQYAVSSISEGDYTLLDCDRLDMLREVSLQEESPADGIREGDTLSPYLFSGASGVELGNVTAPVVAPTLLYERESTGLIRKWLKEEHQESWNEIVKNSRMILASYLRLYCDA